MLKNFKVANLKENLNRLKSQFDRDAMLYSLVFLGVIVYGLPKFVFPSLSEIPSNFTKLMQQKETAKTMELQIAATKQSQSVKKETKFPIEIYEAPYKDVNLENAATFLVNKIISIIKENGESKVEAFEFEKKELTDKSGVKSKDHSVLSLQITMNTSYENLQYILNKIYLMDYLVKIQNVSLDISKESNYKDINVNLIIDLYIKTS